MSSTTQAINNIMKVVETTQVINITNNTLINFFILSQLNVNLEKGMKEAEEGCNKLVKKLDEVEKKAGNTGKVLAELAKRAVDFLRPLVGPDAVKGMVLDFSANADAAGKLALSLNMDVEALQAWQGAAVRAGGDADAFAGSVRNLNGKLDEVGNGSGEAADVFRSLGVSAKDNAGQIKSIDTILLELAGKFAGLSREQAVSFGEKLGLDEGTINLLQKGSDGVDNLLARQKELGLYTQQDAEGAREFNNTLEDLKQVFNSVSAVIARLLLPMLKDFTKWITSFAVNIRENENLVIGFFTGLSIVMGVLAAKTLLAFAPFILFMAVIVAVAAAFAFLYNEIVNFINGNDSMIGRLCEKWNGFRDEISAALDEASENVSSFFRDISDRINSALDAISEKFSEFTQWLEKLGSFFDELAEKASTSFEDLRNGISEIIYAIAGKFSEFMEWIKDLGNIFDWLADTACASFENLRNFISKIIDEVIGKIAAIGEWLGQALDWVTGKISGEATLEIKRSDAESKPGVYQDFPLPRQDDQSVPLPGRLPPDLAADISKGKQAVLQTNTPIASMAGGIAATPQNINKNNVVNVGRVEVYTQATDADGVAGGVGDALEKHFRDAVDNYDDGVSA